MYINRYIANFNKNNKFLLCCVKNNKNSNLGKGILVISIDYSTNIIIVLYRYMET